MVPDVKWKSHPNHPESTLLRFNAALALKVSVASLPAGSAQIKQLAVRTKGCTRQGSTNSTQNRPKIDPKSTPHRPRAPPGRPGGPRARFRTRFRVPGPPPRLTGRLRGVPKSASGNPVVSPGGSREVLGSASGAAGTLGARRAGNVRPVSPPERPEVAFRGDCGTIFERFRVDFRSDLRVLSTWRRGSLREGPTSSSYCVFPHETQVGLFARTARSDRKSTENRCGSAPGASHAENRRKSPEIVENRSRNRPGGTRKGRLGPLGAPLREPRGARWG